MNQADIKKIQFMWDCLRGELEIQLSMDTVRNLPLYSSRFPLTSVDTSIGIRGKIVQWLAKEPENTLSKRS